MIIIMIPPGDRGKRDKSPGFRRDHSPCHTRSRYESPVRRTRDDGRYRESSPRRSSHDHRSPSPVRRTRDDDRYRESSPRRSSHDHRSPFSCASF